MTDRPFDYLLAKTRYAKSLFWFIGNLDHVRHQDFVYVATEIREE